MTLPYLNPTTRAEARANALYYVNMGGPIIHTDRAQTWAAIALTFPEDPIDEMADLEDDEVVRTDVLPQGSTAVINASAGMGPVTVDSDVYDVLRVLAIRCMARYMTTHVDLLDDESWNNELTVKRVDGSLYQIRLVTRP